MQRTRLLLVLASAIAALTLFGCQAGDDGKDGTVGADGAKGADGAPGPGLDFFDVPILEGHTEHGYVLAYDVQAAYNGNTFFWRLSYRGNRGDQHDYLRYTNGAWQEEGGDRRDAQATIDGDSKQGSTDVNSTIYEQRTSIMMNDPNATAKVTNFGKFGCFITCHNQARHMPEWTDAAGEDTKWVNLADAGNPAENTPVLDLWHWRGARSNPIWLSDDQNVLAKTFTNTAGTDNGGRKGDTGDAPFTGNSIGTDGNPANVFDPTTTWGLFAFDWNDFWKTPFYYFTNASAQSLGPTAPNPVTMTYANAVATGYTPVEGDTVPARILRAPTTSRGDITAVGSEFIPESADGRLGVWHVQLQRALDPQTLGVSNSDDVKLTSGQQYDAGFEVHLWEYTTRDHYVSFPQTLGLGSGAPASDITAENLVVSLNGPATGKFPLPNWDAIPVYRIWLFQPGIATWEFLTGANSGKTYTDPVTGTAVDQTHLGASAVSGGTTACRDCHRVRNSDTGGTFGAMETLTKQRGGIWAPTPVQ